jgi:lipopolysaccharide transport system ATP-binding protein
MSDIAIRVENLGKRYRIGKRERYKTLRDSLTDTIYAPFRRIQSAFRGAGSQKSEGVNETIWALKNVSFEIPRGEVVGVIGRNGAGKSTLLKLLSRITEPTEGHAEIHGRVGSLLEVGTGFHPELTGRENIYLNGAILGMRRAEIASKFDEMVAFAEIDKFIDTPVKHYSSGMYMRLAFAVAAHLEPEILVIDEVLAVGDAAFQKKCLGKMGDVAREGRTVLLVSHNMTAIENLSSRSILLEDGRLALAADTSDVIRQYFMRTEARLRRRDLASSSDRAGSGDVRFTRLELLSADSLSNIVCAGETFVVRLAYKCRTPINNPVFSVAIRTLNGHYLFALHTTDLGVQIPRIEGDGCVELEITHPNLLPGSYLIDCALGDHQDPRRFDHVQGAASLEVEAADVYGTGRLQAAGWTSVFFDCTWRVSSYEKVGC